MRAPAPAYAADLNGATIEAVRAAIGPALVDAIEQVGEVMLRVEREGIVGALKALRDTPGLEYQQLMEIAGVDYPDRPERFEVVYCLLSLTRNHRLHVHVMTDDTQPVPSVTGLWPVAGWLEREVYDMYGVLFAGNPDLRRILTDYGFRGHPQRKDFPLSGFVELRYSEEEKRVAYQPVSLAQDFRTFDFMSPWEGAEYVLPGDEKAPQQAAAKLPQAKGAQTPVSADAIAKANAPATKAVAPPSTLESIAGGGGPAKEAKTSDDTSDTGAGKPHPHAGDAPVDPDVKPGGGGQNQ